MTGIWLVLLLIALSMGWLLTLISLPGNWLIVAATALYVLVVPVESSWSIGWPVVVALAILAALAELIEFMAGALGVAQAGGSRRSAVLALGGSILGSLVGLFIGIPIPFVGPVVGVVVCASFGALVGAVLGEDTLGRDPEASWRVGVAAFWGRLLGTLAKTLAGGIMAVVVVVALFFE